MHQVTEITINDVINRAVAFTHRAIEAMRKLKKFDYIDLSREIPVKPTYSPLRVIGVTLMQRDGSTYLHPRDLDGARAELKTVTDGPYSYSIQSGSVYLELPLFMLNFARGFQDIIDLVDYEDRSNGCIYAVNAIESLRSGALPQEMIDPANYYWTLASQPATAPKAGQIPEVLVAPYGIQCYPKSPYPTADDAFDADTPLWQVREAARLRYGQYDPLPEQVLQALDPEKIEHLYPHLPVKPGNTGQIAYTQNAAAGVMDRQAVMRAGRFIRQYARPGLNDEAVKQLAAVVAAHLSSDFHHSTKREDYARVYMEGPSSCMSYGPDGKEFRHLIVDGKFVHPTEVYAHPENDLELVWCEIDGNVIARTIVNKHRMQYPRIYAKESVARAESRLADYLEGLGYTRHDHALSNQKLLRISPDKHPRAIICPYIDSHNMGVDIYEDHLIVGGYESANHETGCLSEYDTSRDDTWECDCCSGGFDEDDERYMDYAGDPICDSCADDYVEAYCTGPQEERWVPRDHNYLFELSRVNTGGLRYYSYIYITSGRMSALSDWGLVQLDDSDYDDNHVALMDDCTPTTHGTYVFTEDLDDHGLFYNSEGGVACEIEDWAIRLDKDEEPELVERSDIDEGLYELAPRKTDSQYPMLPVYTLIAQEEAA